MKVREIIEKAIENNLTELDVINEYLHEPICDEICSQIQKMRESGLLKEGHILDKIEKDEKV